MIPWDEHHLFTVLNQLLGECFQKNSLSKSKLIINPIYTLYHLGIDLSPFKKGSKRRDWKSVEDASHF